MKRRTGASQRAFDEVLDTAHRLLAAAVSPGDAAVDATAGNGHDTLHLARCVGPDGFVAAFDVQEQALEATRRRLAEAGVDDRVSLLASGHETMAEAVPDALAKRGLPTGMPVSAVCFNLGYLPGGDKTIVTRPETTLRALEAALELLAPGGVVTTVLYSGHPGGRLERDAVLTWAEHLPADSYDVLYYHLLNRPGSAELVAISYRPSDSTLAKMR